MRSKRENDVTPSGLFRSRVFVGILCIAAAILLFLANSFFPVLLNRQSTVVVMQNDVRKGQLISENDVKEEVVFTSSVKALSPVRTSAGAIGRYADCDLYAGDILTTVKLSVSPAYNDPSLYDLPAGHMAISISVDSLEEGVADKLICGDVITIYAIADSLYGGYSLSPSEAAVLYPDLQYVKVLSVSDSAGYEIDNAYRTKQEGSTTETRATAAVTLLVNSRQARLIAGIQATGHFHLALAGRGSGAEALLDLQEEYFAAAEAFAEQLPGGENG